MLTTSQKEEVFSLVMQSLDDAEEKWNSGGYIIANESFDSSSREQIKKADVAPSKIPGYPMVSDGETIVDEFIALVADMRGSSNHLTCAISPKRADVSGLQRVFYETSALLPALAKTISFDEGNVTEYLGDGVLALFRVPKSNKSQAIYAANRSANNIITDTRKIVNEVIKHRYSLPSLDLGVGLSISKSIVTLVGLNNEKQAKAFGECVFRATKLSSGTNVVATCPNLYALWPTTKGGILTFRKKNFGPVDGYVISRK